MVKHHAVSWREDEYGNRKTWIVSARDNNQDWDWEAYIGHESAHAGYGIIPLFAQQQQTLEENDFMLFFKSEKYS
ncbi:MAG: hypothetical protein AAGF07_04235 [Patescibacteria group bacterium]